MALDRRVEVAAVLLGFAAVLAWPLSAYEFSPALLPGVLLAVGAIVLSLQRIEYGIAIALALGPLVFVTVDAGRLGEYQPLKVGLPLLAVGLVIWALLTTPRPAGTTRSGGLAAAVTAFIVITAASIAWGSQSTGEIGDFVYLVSGAALMLVTLHAVRTREQITVVVGGLVLALLVAAFHGVYQQAIGAFSDAQLVLEGEAVGRVAGTFGHPNTYAGLLAVMIPLAAALLLGRGVPTTLRVLSSGALVLAIPALNFAYTRGAVGALAIAALLWLAYMRRRAVIAVALVLVVGVAFLVPSAFKERLENVQENEITLRSDLWASSLDIYAESPAIGVGFASFEEGYARLPSTLSAASQRRLLHNQQLLVPPHANNLYLTILAEEGILGLLALLGVGVAALVLAARCSRLSDPLARAVGIGLGAGALTLAFHSILDVTFVPVFGPLLVMGALAALFVAREPLAARAARPAPGGSRPGVAAVSGA